MFPKDTSIDSILRQRQQDTNLPTLSARHKKLDLFTACHCDILHFVWPAAMTFRYVAKVLIQQWKNRQYRQYYLNPVLVTSRTTDKDASSRRCEGLVLVNLNALLTTSSRVWNSRIQISSLPSNGAICSYEFYLSRIGTVPMQHRNVPIWILLYKASYESVAT
ncbi:hypothetical protein TNCV_2533171 [Trichonephila clavipes]|nr:hypothetical protein TNCV_2533171 [Trichonephila clavipes]